MLSRDIKAITDLDIPIKLSYTGDAAAIAITKYFGFPWKLDSIQISFTGGAVAAGKTLDIKVNDILVETLDLAGAVTIYYKPEKDINILENEMFALDSDSAKAYTLILKYKRLEIDVTVNG